MNRRALIEITVDPLLTAAAMYLRIED